MKDGHRDLTTFSMLQPDVIEVFKKSTSLAAHDPRTFPARSSVEAQGSQEKPEGRPFGDDARRAKRGTATRSGRIAAHTEHAQCGTASW
jgi:hypothetical protein